MCGIIGYVGEKHPKEILINGLKRLEYRGYDSSGIALKNRSDIQIIKSKGKIKDLEEKVNILEIIESNIGIAHTRWATHGRANEVNAHPHKVGMVTLVHNGIIENASELKEKLSSVNFISETDTEVACALINKYYKGDALSAINKAISEIKGSYAFGILFDDNEKLYAVRKDSPLIVGIGENENFIASDIAAIIEYTNKYILLEEGEIAEITKDKVIVTKEGKVIEKQIIVTDISQDDSDKCGYNHYMEKEIMEEPAVLMKTLAPYLDDIDIIPDLSKYEEIHFVACGSAMYAGMIGKTLFEEYANLKCYVECASEYRYKKVIYDRKTLVILISQSGETADTIAAMRKAKENSIDTLAIVNVKTSTIARECDFKLFIEAGPEIAVATTKAYLLQVAILSLLAYRSSGGKDKSFIDDAKRLPGLLTDILNKKEVLKNIANEIANSKDAFFIGRGIDYAICLEGSLKLKEVAYTHSEAYQAGELKHGTISLIEKDVPVFAVISDENIKDKTISNIIEVKSRGAKIITVSNDEAILEGEFKIVVPKVSKLLQPILIVPTLQYIGYYVALLRGCDIDKPRNLAKSVTVE